MIGRPISPFYCDLYYHHYSRYLDGKHVEQSQGLDSVLYNNVPLLEVFLQVLGSFFGGPRVNSIKDHFNRIVVAYPHFVCLHK